MLEALFWVYFILTACYCIAVALRTKFSFTKRLGYLVLSPLAVPFLVLVIMLLVIGLIFSTLEDL